MTCMAWVGIGLTGAEGNKGMTDTPTEKSGIKWEMGSVGDVPTAAGKPGDFIIYIEPGRLN